MDWKWPYPLPRGVGESAATLQGDLSTGAAGICPLGRVFLCKAIRACGRHGINTGRDEVVDVGDVM